MIAANDSHDAAQIPRFNAFPHSDFNISEFGIELTQKSICPSVGFLACPEQVISRLNVQARKNCGHDCIRYTHGVDFVCAYV